jgi:hypothetical protein
MKLLIDSHVHLHDCFEPGIFMTSAYQNFKKAADAIGSGDRFTGAMVLLGKAADHPFARLEPYLKERRAVGRWRLEATREQASILAHGAPGGEMVLVAGRQLISSDGLEVLSVGNMEPLTENLPIERLILGIKEMKGLPIIPWGAGKWFGTRGRILRGLMASSASQDFFLGDNGGRPALWRSPRHFQQAKERGFDILRGSDPLPLLWECQRPGSFGSCIDGRLSRNSPWGDLRQMLLDPDIPIQTYGSLMATWRFLLNQVYLKIR